MIEREILLHLPIVVAVARHASFVRAASELSLSPSAVSHAVRVVEQQLGAPLFRRTTRSVSLTPDGERFLSRVMAALGELEEAVVATRAHQGRITGVLRINAPRIAGPLVLTELLADLALRHPELVVEVASEDALVDIVAEGYDAGVRLGEMISPDMAAVRLTPPFKAVIVGAPQYLAHRGEPTSLTQLAAHNTIGYRLAGSGAVYDWELLDEGRDVAVAVQGTVRVSDPLLALDLALAGVGLAYLFEPLVRPHLHAGRLRQVLAESAIEEPGLFLYFPRHLASAPKLRALTDRVRHHLATHDGNR